MDYPACHPGSPARLPNHLAPRPAGGMHMSSHTLSHETRRALDNLKAYLAGENEAVQYAFSFLADMVTQNPSAMLGGIPAGSLPASEVVSRIELADQEGFPGRERSEERRVGKGWRGWRVAEA